MRTSLSFKSNLFHPVPEELDEEHENYINPGIFACELANFLEQGLNANDYKITFRCSEDWGYWQENDFSEHRVFVKPDSPIIRPPRRLFKKTYVQKNVERLVSTLEILLNSHDQIWDVIVGE